MPYRKLAEASNRIVPALLVLFVLSAVDAPTWAYMVAAVFIVIGVVAAAVTWNKPSELTH